MFTAYDNSKERELSFQAGADGFLSKPLNIN
jgi:CheY-like chemotaxis protein